MIEPLVKQEINSIDKIEIEIIRSGKRIKVTVEVIDE